MLYYRPIPSTDAARPDEALPLAGGWCWFDRVEVLSRTAPSQLVPARDVPEPVLSHLTAPRPPIAGLEFSAPRLMGILNVTPDSFSDGGTHFRRDDAIRGAHAMQAAGADLIDIGGESTRPGAQEVAVDEEIRRTAPVIAALRPETDLPISIDTRKTEVARAARDAGADIVNDVAGFTFDPALAPYCARAGLPVVVMHAQGEPETMQKNPHYDHVSLDVYDFLQSRVAALESIGLPRSRIVVDPGIGFGKTLGHNLALLQTLSLFHGLGCAILLGASRKRFIGTLSGTEEARHRAPGSLAVALAGLAQGVQILRIHDVSATQDAMRLWWAATFGTPLNMDNLQV
ncbi:MAG: dihydropteroate synthase [Pseudomonadota bacterium]